MNVKRVVDAVTERISYTNESSIRDSIRSASVIIAYLHQVTETTKHEIIDGFITLSSLYLNANLKTAIVKRNGEVLKAREIKTRLDTLVVAAEDGPVEVTYQYIPIDFTDSGTEIHLPDDLYDELVDKACFYEILKHTGRSNERTAIFHH